MTWPVVLASGGPRERGRAYGSQAAGRIQRSIEIYDEVFRSYAALAWASVRDRAGAFVDAIDAYDHQLLPELEGIAEGAGVDAEDVLALNLRTEVMFGFRSHECTAICARPEATADRHVLLAQNWDWKPAVAETCVVLAMAPTGRPAFATLVEAGLLAKCGVNETGIGLATNALESSRDRGRPGVPYHAVLRKVLTSGSFEAAVSAVTHADRSSSANYVIAHRDGRAVDVEATPDETLVLEGAILAHANHFLWRDRPFKDVGRLDGADSLQRQARADEAMSGGGDTTTSERMKTALRDHDGHPDSICGHADPAIPPVQDYATIGSIVMDLTTGTFELTDGPPCTSAYERYRADELFAAARA